MFKNRRRLAGWALMLFGGAGIPLSLYALVQRVQWALAGDDQWRMVFFGALAVYGAFWLTYKGWRMTRDRKGWPPTAGGGRHRRGAARHPGAAYSSDPGWE